MDDERQYPREQYNALVHVSTPSSTVGAEGQSTEVLQQKLAQAKARLTSLSLRLASTIDALDVQAKAAGRDAALAAEENHALTQKLVMLEAKYLESEYERQDMHLAITELMDKISRPRGFETLSPPALQLTSFLDRSCTPHVSTEAPDSTVESYANNLINFLTSNLKNERVERELLASEAEGQIRRLGAQLARREAEVQASLLENKQMRDLPIHTHRSESKSPEHASVNLILESQNRILEIEIEELKSQLRTQVEKRRSNSASVTGKPGRRASPSLEHPDVIPSSVHSANHAPETLLSILDNQKVLLEHQKQTLTATFQQLREQAVSLQPNEEPVQPSAQAPEDSKAGFERILLIEEECIRLLESERAARKEIIDLKDKELYYLQVISDLKLQVAELRAQPGGRQSNGTAFEARGHHFSLPVNTSEGGSVRAPLDSLQPLSPILSSPFSTDVFGPLSLPAMTLSHRPGSPKSDPDSRSLRSFMPGRSERPQPRHSNSAILPPLLYEQRDGTAGRESGTNLTINSLEVATSYFPEPLDDRIRRLEAELEQARREADEGSVELRHLRAEVARVNAGSPALPPNLIEFGFILPQGGS